mgnify:CR=1 FL=1
MLTRFKAGLPKRWRLRLKAGALALSFAFLSLLPWLHVMTLGSHGGHGCCHHDASKPSTGDVPALASAVTDASAACWVCDSLASLFHANVLTDVPALVHPSHFSVYLAHAPHAPVLNHIYPASRSQAPPASA